MLFSYEVTNILFVTSLLGTNRHYFQRHHAPTMKTLVQDSEEGATQFPEENQKTSQQKPRLLDNFHYPITQKSWAAECKVIFTLNLCHELKYLREIT